MTVFLGAEQTLLVKVGTCLFWLQMLRPTCTVVKTKDERGFFGPAHGLVRWNEYPYLIVLIT